MTCHRFVQERTLPVTGRGTVTDRGAAESPAGPAPTGAWSRRGSLGHITFDVQPGAVEAVEDRLFVVDLVYAARLGIDRLELRAAEIALLIGVEDFQALPHEVIVEVGDAEGTRGGRVPGLQQKVAPPAQGVGGIAGAQQLLHF